MATDKDKPAEPKPDPQVQAKADKELEQGFRGIETDPTPNENYSVAGVTSNRPTPETDDAQADAVREHARGVERGDAGTL